MKPPNHFNCQSIVKVAIFTTFLLFFNSCRLQNESLPEPNTQFDNFVEGQIVLGKQLENPYTVENMKIAHANLTKNGRSGANIRTTHLYLKFNPQNEEELDLLKADTTLEWYDYPLDYEMISGG
ncbi:MAG: hypothetical protein L3J29_12255, partial [Cyclobacteriaceae bacterium]|nr:hypothetical protein [Cyclobacteriaceae bacterium]